ncbi:hypothetical protein L1887_56029 [Cichorium endivia]|nr:hypothetical protein L1887_56029 [Cichorium endivia]
MTTSISKDDQVQKLRKLFASSDIPNDAKAWDQAWIDSTTPWDSNRPQPALVELLSGGHDADCQGTAVVPGCGRGYDARVFAERGLTSYGVDISSNAVAAANQVVATGSKTLTSDIGSNVNFVEADFFTLGTDKSAAKALAKPAQAVLAYDYTFLCAIPPSLRTAWAETYTRLLAKDAILISLVFPIHGDRPGRPSLLPLSGPRTRAARISTTAQGNPAWQETRRAQAQGSRDAPGRGTHHGLASRVGQFSFASS